MTHNMFSPELAQRLANSKNATATKRRKSELAAKRHLDTYLNAWAGLLESPTTMVALKTLKRTLKKHMELEQVEALQKRIDKFLKLPPNEQEKSDCLFQPVGFRRGLNPDTNLQYADRMLDVGFCCEALLCDKCDERLLRRASPSSWQIIKSELRYRNNAQLREVTTCADTPNPPPPPIVSVVLDDEINFKKKAYDYAMQNPLLRWHEVASYAYDRQCTYGDGEALRNELGRYCTARDLPKAYRKRCGAPKK